MEGRGGLEGCIAFRGTYVSARSLVWEYRGNVGRAVPGDRKGGILGHVKEEEGVVGAATDLLGAIRENNLKQTEQRRPDSSP